MISVIGRGSFGQVVKAHCKASGKCVAIKLITNLDNDEYDYVKVVREIQILHKLSEIPLNNYTTKLLDVFRTSCKEEFGVFIVMELLDTDLLSFMTGKSHLNFQSVTQI